MQNRLLETKFHMPPQRTGEMSRPRLMNLLNAGLEKKRKLALISAPAGYGKTTLIAEWLHGLEIPCHVAWLSLEEGDNETFRFFSYWINAIHRVRENVGKHAKTVLGMPNLPSITTLMDELLNELSTVEESLILVLDDYHVIHNTQIHEALEYFLEHLPIQVHLVITTRQDPPLPLARMRARGQMTEIRARDLRFSAEEARLFFISSMKLDISEEIAGQLEERTEGWAVGLQLAGLALQNLADPQHFIETFRGSHRYVLDYLAEEVIRQQEEEIRSFLIRTSILEHFNAETCCVLTGRADAQAIIAQLEQANLFIVPLDDERTWYRYHHLFADYLRTLLSKSEQIELYKKASTWHKANNMLEKAVQYALASRDPDFAADVIGQALLANTTWSGGNVALLSSWLDDLPPQTLQNRPQLSLNASRILYLSGRFDLAEKRINQAENALKLLPATPETEEMLALAALYRGSIASVRGDAQEAIEKITFAQSHLSLENHLAHARAFFGLGLAYEVIDQTDCAVHNYLESSEKAKLAGVLFLAIHARCAAAQVQIKQGRLHLAEQSCQIAIQLAEGMRILPMGLAWIILGSIALERNDLNTAEHHLQEGIALAREGGLTDDLILGLVSLARLHAIKDNTNGFQAVFQEANSIVQMFNVPRMSLIAAAYIARLQLNREQKQAATQWAAEYQSVRAALQLEFADLTLARVLQATGELDLLPSILHPILEKSNAAGRMQTSIEVMLLLALFHQSKKESQSAQDWLGKALQLAAPEGYSRIFLDEGKPMLDLLPKARHFAPELVDSLIGVSQYEGKSNTAPLEQLLAPLSEQELRVLNLIVAGKSNQEIAEVLFISVGTTKWHVHNVLQKLGVNNRPQAIALARELGIG
ncbi:MAG: hypothetical protein CVU39_08820 [Chloroflexi bacterium HGW-Chloroflexi-10]|nr:MAG: hypothetical protein CVU39_08820 [Chloroflexi bacterium HGW-Chloroflexi-10]